MWLAASPLSVLVFGRGLHEIGKQFLSWRTCGNRPGGHRWGPGNRRVDRAGKSVPTDWSAAQRSGPAEAGHRQGDGGDHHRPPHRGGLRLLAAIRQLPVVHARPGIGDAINDELSRWTVIGPAGPAREWDAQIVSDQQNHMISWRSVPGSTVENRGAVRFEDAPGGPRDRSARRTDRTIRRPAGWVTLLPGSSAHLPANRCARACDASSRFSSSAKFRSPTGRAFTARAAAGRSARARRARGGGVMKAACWMGTAQDRGEGGSGSEDPQCARRDHQSHQHGDLRLGPAPLQRLHPVDEEGRRRWP